MAKQYPKLVNGEVTYVDLSQLEDQSQILELIAAEELDFFTLETRNSDGLDFKEVAVWQIRRALERAFEAGKKSTK